jgi:hypothetical protein
MNVTIDTPIEDVLRKRVSLLTLAQLTFNKTSTRTLKALSQFRSPDLAKVIQAKRDGVFDYGEHIKDTDNGVEYPESQEVLEMIEKAASGEAPEPVVEAAPAPKPEAKKAAPKPRRKAAEKKAAPKKESKTQAAPVPQQDLVEEPGAIVERINELSAGLADAFDGLTNRLDESVSRVEGGLGTLAAGVRGLAGLLSTALDRQDTLAQYVQQYVGLMDPDADELEMPQVGEGPIRDIEACFRLVDAAPAVNVAAAPVAEEAPAGAPDVDDAAPEKDTGPPAAPSGNGTVVYTQDMLNKMGLNDLQDLADSLGIPDAKKKAYAPLLVRHILRMQS